MTEMPTAAAVAAKALDGLTMRMAALAQNIANASSPDFQPMKVNFEEALRSAASRGAKAVEALSFAFEADFASRPGDDRRLDLALVDASNTTMRYEALVDMLGRRLALQHAFVGAQ